MEVDTSSFICICYLSNAPTQQSLEYYRNIQKGNLLVFSYHCILFLYYEEKVS